MFGIQQSALAGEYLCAIAHNWSLDPFARGAYSYVTTQDGACTPEGIVFPEGNCIFFSGEAFAEGPEASTVEGALTSGCDVAERILSLFDCNPNAARRLQVNRYTRPHSGGFWLRDGSGAFALSAAMLLHDGSCRHYLGSLPIAA